MVAEKVGDLTIPELVEIIATVPKTYFVKEVEEIVDRKNLELKAEVDQKFEALKTFWVPAEKHYNDHKMYDECAQNRDDWLENHKYVAKLRKNESTIEANNDFVENVRTRGKQACDIGFKALVVAAIGFVITIMWDGIVHNFTSLFTHSVGK